jgi:DNA-directed RNA polymerase specialized sigma24 family protein
MKIKAFIWPQGKVVQGKLGGNVKKQNEASEPYATATAAADHGDAKDWPFHEIVPDGPLMPGLDVLERKEVLPRLAERIAQLPPASKKVLAMYYYENLPISGIAACFDLPARRINEILTQTVGLLRNDLLNV